MTISRAVEGQPLRIPAAAYNAFVDAAEDFARRGLKNGGGGGTGPTTPALTVRVQNDTGAPLAAYAAAAANYSLAEVLSLTDNEGPVNRSPIVSVATVDGADATPYLVILTEPIPEGEVGVGVVRGVCVATVNVTNLAHRYADLSGGTLVSSTTGRVRLLQAATTDTGEQPCLVDVSQTSGGAACGVNYTLKMASFNVSCDGFGAELLIDQVYQIEPNGCWDPDDLFWIAAGGRVVDGDGAGVADVDISSATSDPNAGGTTTYGTVATTDADGYWSGRGRLEIDATSPTPSIYVRFAASGYTPSPAKVYNPANPLTVVDFAP